MTGTNNQQDPATSTNNHKDQPDNTTKPSNGTFFKTKSAKKFLLLAIICLIVLAFTIRFYTEYVKNKQTPKEDHPRNILFSNDYMDETSKYFRLDRLFWYQIPFTD